jgi:signal peptidase I
MSEPDRRLPGVTVPSFVRVITDLIGAPAVQMHGAWPSRLVVRFRVEGLSMYPTIRDGELITVGPVAAHQIARGDVLLCRQSTRLLAHRVVAVQMRGGERVVRLRGDAKGADDAPIAVSDVIGKVVSVQRNGRGIRMSGRKARLRHTVRTVASQVKTLIIRSARDKWC